MAKKGKRIKLAPDALDVAARLARNLPGAAVGRAAGKVAAKAAIKTVKGKAKPDKEYQSLLKRLKFAGDR